jgi:hypothetical protein
MDALEASGCYDPNDGFFYDLLSDASGTRNPVKVQTLVGVIPALPAMSVPARNTERVQRLRKRFARRMEAENRQILDWRVHGTGDSRRALFSIVSPDQLVRISATLFDENAFLSPHGCVPCQSVTQRLIRCPACQVQPSNMSLQNLAPQCMGVTRTGVDRYGSRSII